MEELRFSCGDSNFSVSKQPVAHIDCSSVSNGRSSPLPVTILLLEPGQTIDSIWLEREKTRMIECDDVFNDSFFEHLILCQPTDDQTMAVISISSHDGMQPEINQRPSQDTSTIRRLTHNMLQFRGDPLLSRESGIDFTSPRSCFVCNEWKPSTMGSCLRSGPYILVGSDLYQVYRLYDDPYAAFMFGVVNDGASPPSYQVYGSPQIPVPSRLYFQPASDEYPLRGKRIAVKDVFDLAGVPTSASCRDYQAFSGNAKRSSSMVTRLIDAGAIIVGKTKTAQFASGEHARDWVDYKCPVNPRGDGSLDPGGSSTGSAVAVAAYDWLDYSIGTDTLGSMIGPAAIQGIFGIRPTHGISNLDGVLPVSPHLDTAGFFARSVTDFRVLGHSWYRTNIARSQDFNRLLYANSEFDQFPSDVRIAMDSFVDDMVQIMGQPKTLLDIAAIWDGEEVPAVKRTLNEYLSTTLAHIQLFDCYNNNLKFREEFQRLHGREPYANPLIRFKWELGSRLTPEQYKEAREEQEFYRRFLRHHIFGEKAVLVLPGGDPKPRYRDEYDAFPDQRPYSLQGFGFLRDMYSFLGGLPQLVIPIGAVPRQSPATGAMAEEPISISLVGAPGTDCALMDLAERVLRESKRPMAVLTGSSLFS